MGTRTDYVPGTFCWVDLSTTDPAVAMRFYAGLFGWDFEGGAGDDGTLSLARLHGSNVAAIHRRDGAEHAHWNSDVSVSDADAAAARAAELGGLVLAEPFDVSDAGRAAVIADPAGARFRVWQPRRHVGAGHVNDTGCLTWNELGTNDPDGAIEFYSALFGWTFERVDTGGGPRYWVIGHDAAAMGRNGGMRELSGDDPSDESPQWVPYFTVDSAATAAETVEAMGGSVRFGPVQMGAGMVVAATDPAGAAFRVFDGEVDD